MVEVAEEAKVEVKSQISPENAKHVTNQKSNCFKCNKFGHYKLECKTKAKYEQVECAHATVAKEYVVLACKKDDSGTVGTNIWYLDTDYINHMFG